MAGMFREATGEDLISLLDLERAANLVGLAHVFPADRYPFPDDDVLARWALMMADPDVRVLVRDADGRPDIDVLAAYDARSLRHLAVHPERWGSGLATLAIEAVLDALADRGATTAELWCLELNHRARRLYEHLGWQATADRRPAPWPPHPVEMRYTHVVSRPEG
jgi:GNAT superfamily N-acetyltransferase